jgi:co-chaperonin GroES (HSP10)
MEIDPTSVEDIDRLAKRMPDPKGYKILIALPEIEEQTKGGVFLPEERRRQEETASIVGFVLELGDLCYKDKAKFPTGPWCEKGDFILFRSYSGTRFKIDGKEFRLINDDTVEAVIQDPRGVTRA